MIRISGNISSWCLSFKCGLIALVLSLLGFVALYLVGSDKCGISSIIAHGSQF